MKDKWMTIKEFDGKNRTAGPVWIYYKGRVQLAYYRLDRFMFNSTSSECCLTECIRFVQLIKEPEMPNDL